MLSSTKTHAELLLRGQRMLCIFIELRHKRVWAVGKAQHSIDTGGLCETNNFFLAEKSLLVCVFLSHHTRNNIGRAVGCI